VSKVDQFISYLTKEIGQPYVWGGESHAEGGFDCSGLVQYAMAKVGIQVPRTAREQQKASKPVSTPRPGDMVFYGNPATHMGVYVGNGKMIDAPRRGEKVNIRDVYGNPEYRRVEGLGLGQALGGVAERIGGVGSGVWDIMTDPIGTIREGVYNAAEGVLGDVKDGAIKFGFIVGGITLVALGAWRAASGARSTA
jgi:hypothetical protein